LANDLLAAAALLWIAGGVLALVGRALGLVRLLLGLGGLAALVTLPASTASVAVPLRMADETARFRMAPEALWLMGFGLAPAVLACLLALPAHSLSLADFDQVGATLSVPVQIMIGVLLVIGFGAKLGLLPFYEWFPSAYGSGSGASGALLSGVVLNAAFFGLSRGVLSWLSRTRSVRSTVSSIVRRSRPRGNPRCANIS